jgi:hypothetical protein
VRGGRVNALKQVALLDHLHALEREVDYFGMWIRGGLSILRGKDFGNEQNQCSN